MVGRKLVVPVAARREATSQIVAGILGEIHAKSAVYLDIDPAGGGDQPGAVDDGGIERQGLFAVGFQAGNFPGAKVNKGIREDFERGQGGAVLDKQVVGHISFWTAKVKAHVVSVTFLNYRWVNPGLKPLVTVRCWQNSWAGMMATMGDSHSGMPLGSGTLE